MKVFDLPLITELMEEIEGQKIKRAEFIKKTYGTPIEYKDQATGKMITKPAKWPKGGVSGFKSIDKFIEKLAETDPTTNGMYMQWMAKLVIANPQENKPEDLYKLKDDLTAFEANKSKIENKDVNSYKSFMQLFDVIKSFEKKEPTEDDKEKAKKDEVADKARKESILVYSGPEGWIRIPETQESSIFYGQGTRWCTAASKSQNLYHSYAKRDKLFIIYDKATKDRMQLHVQDGALADISDRHMSLNKLPAWAGKAIAKWYKENKSNLSLKHVLTLGVHDEDLAKGTDHEDVIALMKKFGV